MPRARNQYIEEMRERFEVVNVASQRVNRSYKASNEEKATLTGAAQVTKSVFIFNEISHGFNTSWYRKFLTIKLSTF